jgi:hypothetical protein
MAHGLGAKMSFTAPERFRHVAHLIHIMHYSLRLQLNRNEFYCFLVKIRRKISGLLIAQQNITKMRYATCWTQLLKRSPVFNYLQSFFTL